MARDSRVHEHCHRAGYANGYRLPLRSLRSQEAGLACARLRCMQQLDGRGVSRPGAPRTKSALTTGGLTTSTTRHVVND